MPIATIAGKPILGSSNVEWQLTEGTAPFIARFDLIPQDAQSAFNDNKGTPVSLQLARPGPNGQMTVQKLYILSVEPGPNPHIARVVVADRRWMWPYASCFLQANFRRKVGEKRIEANDQPAVAVETDEIQYARATLFNGDVYSAAQIIGLIVEQAESAALDTANINVSADIQAMNSVPVENVEIRDFGDQAVARALALVPGAGVYIDYEGNIKVYSKSATASGEGALVQPLAAVPHFGGGWWQLVDHSVFRPRSIRYVCPREVEIRVMFHQGGGTVTSDFRLVDNVMPQPDWTLEVNGRTYPTGTFHTMDEYFDNWGPLPKWSNDQADTDLDDAIVRKAMMPFLDLWAVIGAIGQFDADQDWVGRIEMLQAHYRQTFRIKRKMMDRIASIKDYRVATVDVETGSRGKAVAWMDHCKIASQRAIYKNREQGLIYSRNVDGYDGSSFNSTSRAAPAHVSIVDSDQGVFHLDLKPDPLKLYEVILPGKISINGSTVDQNMVTGDISKGVSEGKPVTFDSVSDPSKPIPSLAANFKMTTILTAVPWTGRGLQKLHKITVQPSDVQGMVPGGIGPCAGPVMTIFSDVEPARVQWLDSREADLDLCFGIQGGQDEEAAGEPNLNGLVLNEGTAGDAAGGASLWALAKAEAARQYAMLADRFLGSVTGPMTGAMEPTGYVDQVAHMIDTQGVATTSVKFPDRRPMLSIYGFLDSTTRQRLSKLVQL